MCKGINCHAQMLGKVGLITSEEAIALEEGLNDIGKQIEEGNFTHRR